MLRIWFRLGSAKSFRICYLAFSGAGACLDGWKYSSSVARIRTARIWVHASSLAFKVISYIPNFQISTRTSHQQRIRSSTIEPTHKFPTHDQAHLTSHCKGRHNPCQQKILSPKLSLLSRASQPHTGSRSANCSFSHKPVNTSLLPRPSVGNLRADRILPNPCVSQRTRTGDCQQTKKS